MEWNGGERADVFLGPVHDHAVHPRDLRGRGRRCPPKASCTRRCSPTTSTPSSTGHDVVWGPDGRRGPVRATAASRSSRRRAASGSSSWSSSRRAPHEGHPVPPRVGELQRRAARRHGRLLRRPASASPTCPGPRSPASPGTGTASATSELHSSARRRAGRPSTRPATTTASRSTTSTPRSPSSRRGASSTSAAVQGESNVQIWITDPAGNTIELQQETRPQ